MHYISFVILCYRFRQKRPYSYLSKFTISSTNNIAPAISLCHYRNEVYGWSKIESFYHFSK